MSTTKPTPSRRYGEALEKALLAAAWQELKTVGYYNLTLDGVAKRAGTSKAVLYRRWANRLELVRAAMRAHQPLVSGKVPDTGSLRDDVTTMLERIASGLSQLHLDVVWGMMTDAVSDNRQHSFLQHEIHKANLSAMRAVLRQAEVRGELNMAAIPERIITVPFDLVRHEMIITGRPPTKTAIREIVDGVFLPLVEVSKDNGQKEHI